MKEETVEKKFYKIGEVAELLDVSIPTLRYWEECFPQLRPRRNAKGSRFYTAADMETLRIIRFLVRDRGLKLAAAEEQLRNNRSGIARKAAAVERLRAIRKTLTDILEALPK